MRRNFMANTIVVRPGMGYVIHEVYNKLPGVVCLGSSHPGRPLCSYDRWLVAMGMYETLNLITGLEVEYYHGR